MAFFQRLTKDASNAITDAYGTWILGDDAGQSSKVVFMVRPQLDPKKKKYKLKLGMTFIEVNGRAYVQTVAPGSEAAKAGVLAKDAVQYAALISTESPEEENWEELEEFARNEALTAEGEGRRINYEELRRVLQQGMDTSAAFLSRVEPSSSKIPTTINVCADTSMLRPFSPTISETGARPVVFVMRRTKQRAQPYLSILPGFRLDDECDGACEILHDLAPAPTHAIVESSDFAPPSPRKPKDVSTELWEKERAQSIKSLRTEMVERELEHSENEQNDEASTIRSLIQSAVGVAFIRASKVVMGVSVHAGSGVVIARLSDGTWSAPSAIGVCGLGVGVQVGLEVASYIFILQTQESLEHFLRGGSFTVGGNVGASVAGVGREAYGAASVGAMCGSPSALSAREDEYNDSSVQGQISAVDVAPIVAYAKSKGLYVGVSLEGSRIFTRSDINRRTYKFVSGKDVTAHDILSGKVATPAEAEDLYAALHQVEFVQELEKMKRPPRKLLDGSTRWAWTPETSSSLDFDSKSVSEFEQEFKNFLFGGISVQRLIPNGQRERRTLWLLQPASASLRIGFVVKFLDDSQRGFSNGRLDTEDATLASEEVTLDSALIDRDNQSITEVRTGLVELSPLAVAITDVTEFSQGTNGTFSNEDTTEQLRAFSIKDVNGISFSFLVNSAKEAELLWCGLNILLHKETKRIGVRGGSAIEGARPEMTPATARGDAFRRRKRGGTVADFENFIGDNSSFQGFGRVPGRSYLRTQAEAFTDVPKYVHGQLLVRDLAKHIKLPLPLPLCRVLLLDSSSPVTSKWEADRGDSHYETGPWTFPPATPRSMEQFTSEHQLIASGSMHGAHRTISFQRPRNGSVIRLSETQVIDADDSEKLAFTLSERMPRRGFAVKVKVILRPYTSSSCEATVLGEIRPVGKNMSNQAAVHKAFLMVVEELKARYGQDNLGLFAGFLSVVENMSDSETRSLAPKGMHSSALNRSFPEEKKENETRSPRKNPGVVSFEDMLKADEGPSEKFVPERPTTPSLHIQTPESDPGMRHRSRMTEMKSDVFEGLPGTAKEEEEPVMIEVKPLPKIRLSLMPSPREEDEYENEDDSSKAMSRTKRKKSRSSKKIPRSASPVAWRKPSSKP